MRIALIGQAEFGEAVFRALREAGEEIVAVSSITGTPERPDALWATAQAAGGCCGRSMMRDGGGRGATKCSASSGWSRTCGTSTRTKSSTCCNYGLQWTALTAAGDGAPAHHVLGILVA